MQWSNLLLFVFLYSCSPNSETLDPYVQISDSTAREIIRQAINHAGGLDRWNAIKQLDYKKEFKLYSEEGSIEKSYSQLHKYDLVKDNIWIQYIENNDTITTIKNKQKYSRSINGKNKSDKTAAFQKLINTSLYVIGMPFKLLDEGTILSYIGDTILRGDKCNVLEARYNTSEYSSHSGNNTWRYYFHDQTKEIVANWVDAGDHFSFISNLTTKRNGGILFNAKRESHRVDSLGQKLYLRADYLYSDYKVIY